MNVFSTVWQVVAVDGTSLSNDDLPVKRAITTGKTVRDLTIGIFHPEKQQRIWIKVTSVPEFKENETKPFRVYTVFEDISDKLQLQNKLEEIEIKFDALFENGPIGVAFHKMIYDDEGTPIDYYFLDANKQYLELTSVDPRGKLVTEAFPGIEKDPSDWIGTFARAGKYGETIRFQQYLAPNDRWYDAVGYQSSPDHFVAAFLEITEQKKKEQELERLKAELEKKVEERTEQLKLEKENAEAANQAKTVFLANMSHELRTPLNAVLGYADILNSRELDSNKKNYINSISVSGKSLLSLINDILDLSKIETGKYELQYEVVRIRNIILELETVFAQKIIDKGLDFSIDIATDVPEYLLLDEVRLRQIMLNLLGNAVKFTEKGKISLHCSSFRLNTSDKGTINLQIDVRDTGKGIADDQQERIFNAFEQAKAQKISEYGGTGLGLAISKNLAELMNGEITVKSQLGKGSQFLLIIKDIEVADASFQSDKHKTVIDPDTVTFAPAKILIVDDVQYNLDVFGTYLETYNLDLEFAYNGQEALDKIKQSEPDLILLDMKMPVMDGYELSNLLKQSKKYNSIPIIVVSASSLKHEEEQIKQVCDGYLRKPVSRAEMITEMSKFLESTIDEPLKQPNGTTNSATLTPAEDIILEFCQYAKLGNMDKIIELSDKYIECDPQCAPFYKQLKQLAMECDESKIASTLNHCQI